MLLRKKIYFYISICHLGTSLLYNNFLHLHPMQMNQRIEALQALLKLEKQADFEQFRQQVQELTQTEKREKGLSWYPLEVKKEGYTIGDRAFVTVERTSHLNESHRIRSGSPVDFYSNASDTKNKRGQHTVTGVINFVERNKMKIILNSKDLPDWLRDGSLGVDLSFDERTYLEMEKALKTLHNAKNDRVSELKSIFYGEMKPQFDALIPVEHPYLNEAQKKAVQHILAARDVAIVHGPPGTGKTTTLVHAIKMLSEKEKHILVTASSNAAVDLLAERLNEKKLTVVRIGNISRVDERLISLTLEGRLSKHPESKNIKKVKIEAAKARREAKKFKRKFGQKERIERREAYREAKELADWAKALEERVITQILNSADIIACTLVNSIHRSLENLNIRTIVIDEAAQALEPASWIPILRAEKVVLAGDPFQLPPTVKSEEARRGGFGKTLLEKWVDQYPQVSFLNVQYRMNEAIMGFSNQQFYNGQLIAAEEVVAWQLDIAAHKSVRFIDTAGAGFEEEINPETKSRFNKGEYFILREYFLQFIKKLADHNQEIPSMAIISPYREQCRYISDELAEDEELQSYLPHLDINSIDAFQGQERDVIFISLVRSNEKSEIGFLTDYRRMNVAMTRAKKHLVIIGDSATLGNDSFYSSFFEYVEKEGEYDSAWTYMS